jgi:hypothetical protein
MDKITFESVMEEIKKSLGEARLMDIEEAAGYSNLTPTQKTEYMKKASETGAAKRLASQPSTNPTSTSSSQTPAVGPFGGDFNARRDAAIRSSNDDRDNAEVAANSGTNPANQPTAQQRGAMAQRNSTPAAQAAASRPSVSAPAAPTRPDTTNDTVSRMGQSSPGAPVASGRGDGAAELAARKAASTPSPPKSQGVTNQPAPKSQGVTNQPAPKSQGVTNQPATSSDNKYGYAKSGSDEDNASNFFRADAARMKDQGKKAPNDFSEAKKMYAENFDQFVKKFLKESR